MKSTFKTEHHLREDPSRPDHLDIRTVERVTPGALEICECDGNGTGYIELKRFVHDTDVSHRHRHKSLIGRALGRFSESYEDNVNPMADTSGFSPR